MGESRLCHRYNRLFDLAENKLMPVANMFVFGWGEGAEAWKWRSCLFAWEEEQVVELSSLVSNIVLKENTIDRWVWLPNLAKTYSVSSAYDYLISMDNNDTNGNNDAWSKVVPLKLTCLCGGCF